MKIDELTIERIKDAARIEDVVGDFVRLRRTGARFTDLCPFHDDRHDGNFIVYPKLNVFRCFACDAKGGPIEFLMKHAGLSYPDALRWLGQKYGIFIDEERKFTVKPSKPLETPRAAPELTTRYWPLDFVKGHFADESDTFVAWLYSLPWDGAQRARIPKVLRNYGVGHSHFATDWQGRHEEHDFTVFWQVDEQARLCNGHFMKYKADGHRVKEKDGYNTTWLHARMKYAPARFQPFDEGKEKPAYCLFGQHLMTASPDATINIVESEKTALVMAIAYGNPKFDIWMACCGVRNLINSHNLLQPLIDAGKRIVLYPDHDGVEAWQDAAKLINYPRLTVYTKPVTQWWKPEDGDHADIADIIVRSLKSNKRLYTTPPTDVHTIIREWGDKFPAFKALEERFDIEVKS